MLYQAGWGFSKLKIGSLCWQLGNLQPQFQPNWPKVTYDCQIWPRQAAISPGTTTCLLHVYYISSNTPTTTSCSLIKRTSLAKQKPLQELFNPGNAPRIPGFCIHPPAQMLTFSNPHPLSKHLSPPSFKNLDPPI